ncbi:MAG TPA: HPr family phosphocarrier protein [Lachnospiraceae bacterium]|nr:HPr family phosphocarrier protein [Lachnospiraceae bacterium]
MIKKKVIVTAKAGLHARPANLLIKEAQHFQSEIEIGVNNQLYNAKSLLGILAAGVDCGTEIEVVCNGSDEKAACDAVIKLLASGLGE